MRHGCRRHGRTSSALSRPIERHIGRAARASRKSSGRLGTRSSCCKACSRARTRSAAIRAWRKTSSGFSTSHRTRRSCCGRTTATSPPEDSGEPASSPWARHSGSCTAAIWSSSDLRSITERFRRWGGRSTRAPPGGSGATMAASHARRRRCRSAGPPAPRRR